MPSPSERAPPADNQQGDKAGDNDGEERRQDQI